MFNRICHNYIVLKNTKKNSVATKPTITDDNMGRLYFYNLLPLWYQSIVKLKETRGSKYIIR